MENVALVSEELVIDIHEFSGCWTFNVFIIIEGFVNFCENSWFEKARTIKENNKSFLKNFIILYILSKSKELLWNCQVLI